MSMIIGATFIIVGVFVGWGGINYFNEVFFVSEPLIPVIITDKDIMLNMSKFNFLSYEEWKLAKQNVILQLNVANTVLIGEQNYSNFTYEAERIIFFESYYPHIIEQNYLDNVNDVCSNEITFLNDSLYNKFYNGPTYIHIEECINKGKVVDFYWETSINDKNN